MEAFKKAMICGTVIMTRSERVKVKLWKLLGWLPFFAFAEEIYTRMFDMDVGPSDETKVAEGLCSILSFRFFSFRKKWTHFAETPPIYRDD